MTTSAVGWKSTKLQCRTQNIHKVRCCYLRSFALKITLGRLNFHAKSDKPIIGVCADVIGSLTNQERARDRHKT